MTLAKRSRLALLLLAAALLGCRSDLSEPLDADLGAPPPDARPPAPDRPAASPDQRPASDLGGGCAQQTIPLEVLGSGADLQFYLAVTYQGQPVMMMLDTG